MSREIEPEKTTKDEMTLGRHIWTRYAHFPSTVSALQQHSMKGCFSVNRLPLLAKLQRRWTQSALSNAWLRMIYAFLTPYHYEEAREPVGAIAANEAKRPASLVPAGHESLGHTQHDRSRFLLAPFPVGGEVSTLQRSVKLALPVTSGLPSVPSHTLSTRPFLPGGISERYPGRQIRLLNPAPSLSLCRVSRTPSPAPLLQGSKWKALIKSSPLSQKEEGGILSNLHPSVASATEARRLNKFAPSPLRRAGTLLTKFSTPPSGRGYPLFNAFCSPLHGREYSPLTTFSPGSFRGEGEVVRGSWLLSLRRNPAGIVSRPIFDLAERDEATRPPADIRQLNERVGRDAANRESVGKIYDGWLTRAHVQVTSGIGESLSRQSVNVPELRPGILKRRMDISPRAEQPGTGMRLLQRSLRQQSTDKQSPPPATDLVSGAPSPPGNSPDDRNGAALERVLPSESPGGGMMALDVVHEGTQGSAAGEARGVPPTRAAITPVSLLLTSAHQVHPQPELAWQTSETRFVPRSAGIRTHRSGQVVMPRRVRTPTKNESSSLISMGLLPSPILRREEGSERSETRFAGQALPESSNRSAAIPSLSSGQVEPTSINHIAALKPALQVAPQQHIQAADHADATGWLMESKWSGTSSPLSASSGIHFTAGLPLRRAPHPRSLSPWGRGEPRVLSRMNFENPFAPFSLTPFPSPLAGRDRGGGTLLKAGWMKGSPEMVTAENYAGRQTSKLRVNEGFSRWVEATPSPTVAPRRSSLSVDPARELLRPMLSQRLLRLQRAAVPSGGRAGPLGPNLSATPGFTGGSSQGAPGVDVTQLADQVYRLLVRRLAGERERRGA